VFYILFDSPPINARRQKIWHDAVTLMRLRRSHVLLCLLVLGVVLGKFQLLAAERQPSGRGIYRQQCAKCHGRKGEGVEGKFDGPLKGDRPLEKLTRYIDRNMPDDAPEKCVGEDAAAVARYIYDAFYSREAQTRKNPPRVELVRLTNRQYVNTVSDLIKHFTGSDPKLTDARGLRAVYYRAKDFARDKQVIDRVDRQVDLDFGSATPDAEHFPTNQYSIQWRGSLIADETGDYEFIVKSPNGVRLWLNDNEEPLIDAWVASGQQNEYKATTRLIGRRVYPLMLDYFKFKDKTGAVSLQWKPAHGTQRIIPARNLWPTDAKPTLVINTPFPADDSSVGYERGVAISKAWDEATTQAAIEVANYVAKHLDRLSRSKPGDTNRTVKVEAFCTDFVAQAFRRPLTTEQKRVWVASQFKRTAKIEDAVQRVVLRTLKSPRFLYLGLDGDKPDGFEVASRLSFGLWDSLPDSELWKQAAADRLRTREDVARQARRMLGDPRAHAKMQYFLHHWLQVNRLESLSKDDKLFPGFTPEIIADLRTSLNSFLEDVVWSDASDYRTLLLADYLFVNNRLAQFYGLSTNESDDFVKVTPDTGQRSGVLTHPYLLAALSYQKQSSPIHRGVFLTRNIVGRTLRPPPMAQTFNDSTFSPNLTMREKVSELTRPQNCQMCHSVINPLGFSLEHYDAVGRFRTRENDRPIDATSDYTTDDGQVVRLAGARDVAQFALSNEQALDGFIQQLFHQVLKQPMLAYGTDIKSQLRRSFVASEFNLQNLLVEIATISAMHGTERQIASKRN